jgi:hypothetical protein
LATYYYLPLAVAAEDDDDGPRQMATNPSHILIARNSARGGPGPAGLLSSPIETHAAASGIFRSSGPAVAAATVIGSPPWLLEEVEAEEAVPELNLEDAEDCAIEVDPTFREGGAFPGNVKIIVESTTFW